MKNSRKRKLDILLSKDVLEKDEEKVKNLKQNVPEPMSIEETQSESHDSRPCIFITNEKENTVYKLKFIISKCSHPI